MTSLSTVWYQLVRALRGGGRHVVQSPLIQITAIGTMGLMLALVGIFPLGLGNLTQVENRWRTEAQMSLYLEDGLSPERVQQIAASVAKLGGVEKVEVVSAERAYERLRDSLGTRAGLLSGVDATYLPSSIEVSLKPGVAAVLRSHPAFVRLERLPGVESVELLEGWGDRLRSVSAVAAQAAWAIGFLLALACLYVVASTIRIGVWARRAEVEVLRLVGATESFIGAPFVVEGTLQGFFGAGAALALLYGFFRLAEPRAQAVMSDLLVAAPLRFFGPSQIAAGLGIGALVGMLGSWVAVRRHVRR